MSQRPRSEALASTSRREQGSSRHSSENATARYARAAGDPQHVALGTDLDGGFDAKHAPIADLSELKELPARLRLHFSRSQVDGIMGGNWLAFLERSLP